MKLSNCVVGQVIEAKRDVRSHMDAHIRKGTHVTINRVTTDDSYPLRVTNPAIDCGYAWVEPKDFRKVVQETAPAVQVDDAVPDDVQKGTKVLCVQDFVEPRFSDYFKEGVVYVVQKDGLDHDGELNLEHPSLDAGHGYGKPQNFRLYKEPQEAVAPSAGIDFSGLREHQERMLTPEQPVAPVLTEECTAQNLQVGDTVVVGAEGAGYNLILPEYAGLTCEVTRVHPDGSVDIKHPDVYTWGNGYRSKLEHLTKVVKEAVVEPTPVVQEKLPPTYIQVGDYILSSGRDPELEADTLYEVVQVDPRHIAIALHTSSNKVWQESYCLVMSDYSKVLREVQPDAAIPNTEPTSSLVGCTVRVKEDVVARHGENIPKGTVGTVASIRGDNGQVIVRSPIGWLGQFTVDKDVLEQVKGDADVPTA